MYELKESSVHDVVNAMRESSVFKPEDINFLMEKKDSLKQVMERSWIWRTELQKQEIISDQFRPTLHAKFHQAILEQKVQFEQAMYLAKEYELKLIKKEELELNLEELPVESNKRNMLIARKLRVEIVFKNYELKQIEIAMHYRMDEVKGWQVIIEDLIRDMKSLDYTDEQIWNKQEGEIEDFFFTFLTKLQGIKSTTDAGERSNLLALATFGVEEAKQMGIYEKLKTKCDALQLDSLKILGMNGVSV